MTTQTPRERMVAVVARKLMTQHNDEYAIGTQRDSFVEPPIWMTRKAETIVSALADAGLVGETEEFAVQMKGVRRPWFVSEERAETVKRSCDGDTLVHRLVTRWEEVK